jgi:hypothetical protein
MANIFTQLFGGAKTVNPGGPIQPSTPVVPPAGNSGKGVWLSTIFPALQGSSATVHDLQPGYIVDYGTQQMQALMPAHQALVNNNVAHAWNNPLILHHP